MHPCPIGRGLSLYSNLYIIDKTRSDHFQKETFGSKSGSASLPREASGWERSSYRVRNRIAHRGKGLPRVEKNSLLFVELKEKEEEVCEG